MKERSPAELDFVNRLEAALRTNEPTGTIALRFNVNASSLRRRRRNLSAESDASCTTPKAS